MKKYQEFEKERLILSPTSANDAAFICELFNSPKWIEYIGDRNIKTTEMAEVYIQNKMLPQLERLGYSNYTVIRKADQVKIGTCGLYDRAGLAGIDIGFAFLPEYEKNGYAFEAATKIRDAAFNVFGIECISAITTKGNVASQKLIEKLGMVLIGPIRIPNDPEELLLYRIESED